MHSQDVYPLDISTRAGFLKEVRIPIASLQSCHDSFVGFTFRTFARKGPESNRRNLCPCGQCKCSSQRHTEVLGVVCVYVSSSCAAGSTTPSHYDLRRQKPVGWLVTDSHTKSVWVILITATPSQLGIKSVGFRFLYQLARI